MTRLAALIAVCATIPALGRLISLMVRSGDRKPGITVNVSGAVADPDELVARLRAHLGIDGDMPYGGYPK